MPLAGTVNETFGYASHDLLAHFAGEDRELPALMQPARGPRRDARRRLIAVGAQAAMAA